MVFQAHDPHIDRMVALKVLRQDRISSGAFAHRFMREARAIGRLSHPNIVTVYDIAESGGTAYISMEYVEGRPLDEVIKEKDFSLLDIMDLGVTVAETLDYAHRRGIVHRDVKPSNIILQPDGRIKITDFGIARMEDSESSHQTQAGVILGTPSYMSPEQASGGRVDGRSDLFSLGVILYEIAARERPFRAESLTGVLHAIASLHPPDLSSLNRQFPEDLSRVIQKCLSKDPGRRYASGKELAEDLRLCRERMMRSTAGRGTSVKKRSGSGLWVGGACALLLLLTGISYSIWLISGRQQKPELREREPAKGEVSTLPLPGPPALLHPPLQPPTEESSTQPPAPAQSQTEPPRAIDDAAEPAVNVGAPGAVDRKPPALTVQPERPWKEPVGALIQPADSPPRDGSKGISAGHGFVKIDTLPPGAQILVDGKLKGLSPYGGEIPAGAHLVEIQHDDYAGWEGQLEVVENKEIPLKVKLLPLE